MTEMEYITHDLLRRQFPTPLWLFILYAAPSQKNAQFARDDTICAKNSTFGYFDGTNPITGKGLQLWSFLLRFAPEANLICKI